MADKKITQLTNITGANLAEADEFVVVDITADETKAITFSELKTAFDTGTGFVRITGDTMTGALTTTGLTVTSGSSSDNIMQVFGGGTIYAGLGVDGTGAILTAGSSGSADSDLIIKTSTGGTEVQRARFQDNGDISFYEDTGTTAKFFWDASAESLGIGQGVFSGTQALNIKGEGIAIKNDKSGSNNNWSLIRNTGTSSTSNVSFVTGAGEAMVLAHNKNVGIGTDSPSESLHVVDSGNIQLKLSSNGTNANSRMVFSPSDGDKDWNIGANDNGLFTLYDGTTNVLSVSSTGIDVTGTVTADGLTVDSGTASPIINLSRSGTYSGITFSQTISNTTGAGADLITYSSNNDTGYAWQTKDSGGTQAKALLIAPNRDISFYEDTGTTAKFFWDSSAEELQLGGNYLALTPVTSGTTGARISANANGMLRLASGGSDKVYILDSGNVGIGVNNPAALLEVEGSRNDNWAGRFENTNTGGYGVLAVTAASTSNDRAFEVRKNTSDVAMMILGDGNVGIGEDNPSAPLVVNATASSEGLRVQRNGVSSQYISIHQATGGDHVIETFGNKALNFGVRDAQPITFKTNNTERMRIDSSGRVGIGTSSPDTPFHILQSAESMNDGIKLVGSSGPISGRIYMKGEHLHIDNATAGEGTGITLDDGGNIGIGTDSPTSKFHVYGGNSGTGIDIATFKSASGAFNIKCSDLSATNPTWTLRTFAGEPLAFGQGTDERMRIDASGRLLLGSSSSRTVQGFHHKVQVEGTNASTASLSIVRNTNSVDPPYITFGKTRSGSVGASGIVQQDDVLGRIDFTGANGSNLNELGARIDARVDGTPSSSDMPTRLTFQTSSDGSANPTERMRIDSSGNVLVNTTNADVGFSTTNGSALHPTGQTHHSSAGTAIVLNRTGSNGTISQFRKDGTPVGSIKSGPFSISATGVNNTGWSFGDNSSIEPMKNQATADNAVDLGSSSKRLDDIYATNGTIQTSDFNEKQDIASLTATEMLVGKRISALFKTFRWKDSVAENGDNARTHTGVIAQDVQAAFTAEGLDAGDYALFISSTWFVDTEGNEVEEGTEGATSKTRLGIRYPELLSFVAAYNEQRFASIEARLTALEG